MPSSGAAHEIPYDVTIRIIVSPKADRVALAVRAPLKAMQDTDFATTGPGYLDLVRAAPSLRDAAMLWLAVLASFR